MGIFSRLDKWRTKNFIIYNLGVTQIQSITKYEPTVIMDLTKNTDMIEGGTSDKNNNLDPIRELQSPELL